MDVELGAGQRLTLSALEPSVLGAAGRIDALVALQQLRSWVDAQEQVVLAATVEPGDPPRAAALGSVAPDKQYVREEIACALRISPLTVNARLHVAQELVDRLPRTLALLDAGVMTMRAARFLAETLAPLPDQVVTEVERRVLDRAPQQTFPNFRACVQRAVLALDPRGAQEKHDVAVQRRRVETRPLEDGMASLYAELRADDLQALLASVQACADALPAVGYPAGPHAADQRRADALVALTTGCPAAAASGGASSDAAGGDAVRSNKRRHGRRPGVQVTVALSTLLGVDDEPGELDGHGPIPAALARRIAADASGTWRRLVTDPLGRLADYGRTLYQPPQDLTDHVIARDIRCRFPGCRRQAARCDLDHQTAWADHGPTNARNLQALCARHHALKHEAGWTVHGDPAGTLTWTSPTGHIHLSPPGEQPIDTTMPAANGDEHLDKGGGMSADERAA